MRASLEGIGRGVLSTERERERDRGSCPVAIVTKTSLPESLLSDSDTLLTHVKEVPHLSPLYIHR